MLADLRSTCIGNGLASSAEILHRRNLVTKETTVVDFKAVRATLLRWQAGQAKPSS